MSQRGWGCPCFHRVPRSSLLPWGAPGGVKEVEGAPDPKRKGEGLGLSTHLASPLAGPQPPGHAQAGEALQQPQPGGAAPRHRRHAQPHLRQRREQAGAGGGERHLRAHEDAAGARRRAPQERHRSEMANGAGRGPPGVEVGLVHPRLGGDNFFALSAPSWVVSPAASCPVAVPGCGWPV